MSPGPRAMTPSAPPLSACLFIHSARVVKTRTGDGTTSYADVRRDGHYTQYLQGNGLSQNALWGNGVVFRGDGTPRIPPQLEYCSYMMID